MCAVGSTRYVGGAGCIIRSTIRHAGSCGYICRPYRIVRRITRIGSSGTVIRYISGIGRARGSVIGTGYRGGIIGSISNRRGVGSVGCKRGAGGLARELVGRSGGAMGHGIGIG